MIVNKHCYTNDINSSYPNRLRQAVTHPQCQMETLSFQEGIHTYLWSFLWYKFVLLETGSYQFTKIKRRNELY